MASLAGFDASTVEPAKGFEPIPAGDYVAMIIASEMKKTQGGGQRLALTLQVIDGQYQNRKLFDNLNLVNNGENKATTEQIAKATLSAICRAVGKLTPNDSSELHHIPLRVRVGIGPDQYGNQQNVVKAYKPRDAGPSLPVPPVQKSADVDANFPSPEPPFKGQKAPWEQ